MDPQTFQRRPSSSSQKLFKFNIPIRLPRRPTSSRASRPGDVVNISEWTFIQSPTIPESTAYTSRDESLSKPLEELNKEADDLIRAALRSSPSSPTVPASPRHRSSISSEYSRIIPSRMSLSSMMPSLSGLSLTRTFTNEESRGRKSQKDSESRSSSVSAQDRRSRSPFSRRSRTRERSPSIEALRQNQSDIDSDSESVGGPRSNAYSGDSSSSDTSDEEDLEPVDAETEENTEKNALSHVQDLEEIVDAEPDPLGEGVNVVRPAEPLFAQAPTAGPRRKKTIKHDVLSLNTSPPHFQKDRCTVVLTHGDPAAYNEGRRPRRYIVASDLSEESKFAVEWGVGTVLKDGDEMIVITVVETDTKLDSIESSPPDRMSKLRNQQERQTFAYLLGKQVTGLLQRTKLHVTVKCQAIHARNSRHMLLDLIDHYQPIMVIVGSRGTGKLKGILLGSTSHYLIQKSSVPVMVARRRLKRAVRRHSQIPAHTTRRVTLAEAIIEKTGPGKAEKDVEQMRNDIAQEEAGRKKEGKDLSLSPASPISPGIGLGIGGLANLASPVEDEDDDSDREGVKVPG